MTAGLMETARRGEDIVLTAAGAWTIQAAGALDEQLGKLAAAGAKKVLIVLADLTALDTAGAWLIARTERELKAAGIAVDIGGAKPGHQALLTRIMEAGQPPPVPPVPRFHLIDVVANIGEAVIHGGRQARDMLAFFGAIVIAIGRLLRRPSRIRFVSLVSNIEQHGLNAMPIVGILLFLVGIVARLSGRRPAAAVRGRDLRRRPASASLCCARWACSSARSWSPAARAAPSRPRSAPCR